MEKTVDSSQCTSYGIDHHIILSMGMENVMYSFDLIMFRLCVFFILSVAFKLASLHCFYPYSWGNWVSQSQSMRETHLNYAMDLDLINHYCAEIRYK